MVLKHMKFNKNNFVTLIRRESFKSYIVNLYGEEIHHENNLFLSPFIYIACLFVFVCVCVGGNCYGQFPFQINCLYIISDKVHIFYIS
jgi:hypothetical protein